MSRIDAEETYYFFTAVTKQATERRGRSMLNRWQGGIATVLTVLCTLCLVVLDLTDPAVRDWWAKHPFSNSTVTGLLVMAITVLVVNQVLNIRHVRNRAQATAAQAAIVMSQATRTTTAVLAASDGSGSRDAASEEARTYMSMLLVAAPILIDAAVPRQFLEQAQELGRELARSLGAAADYAPSSAASGPLARALDRMKKSSTPLFRTIGTHDHLPF